MWYLGISQQVMWTTEPPFHLQLKSTLQQQKERVIYSRILLCKVKDLNIRNDGDDMLMEFLKISKYIHTKC